MILALVPRFAAFSTFCSTSISVYQIWSDDRCNLYRSFFAWIILLNRFCGGRVLLRLVLCVEDSWWCYVVRLFTWWKSCFGPPRGLTGEPLKCLCWSMWNACVWQTDIQLSNLSSVASDAHALIWCPVAWGRQNWCPGERVSIRSVKSRLSRVRAWGIGRTTYWAGKPCPPPTQTGESDWRLLGLV